MYSTRQLDALVAAVVPPGGRIVLGQSLIAAFCFGAAFALPFIVWGIILIVDRDRTWQSRLRRSKPGDSPRRTQAWDRRQIVYGISLAAFGIAVLILLATFNFLAQRISPAAPF